MNILMLKLILAPVIIGSASMAGRRWGAAVSGWLVGLPLTSGPVAFFLALSHDRAFVFDSVRGTLSGGFSLVAFSLTYAWVSRKFNWVVSILSGVVVFASMTTLLQNITIPFLPLFAAVIVVIFIGLRLMPKGQAVPPVSNPGGWDIPARILIGTSFILLITGIAPYIGSRLTGLLTTIPLYVSILTIFSHRHQGHAGAVNVLHGLILGLFSFAGFYLVLGLLIERSSLAASFGSAILATLVVQGLSLLILRQRHIHKGE
ncbi:MAG TPA: hypothetical protein PKE35_18650 [Anaerolineales bacterium]|nr:hypothetical protein [Anaerolineales bacterium]HMV97737.1 hypothetical protein [Anaerolineales bacterium]HMX19633.1 hypothetical protein [Anaerolineales bacterium]HMX76281.1 hypothetical protein [Anaerolineales bacterium]HMZ45009.1 hypothetical protein [Anaerolineales bacterium]